MYSPLSPASALDAPNAIDAARAVLPPWVLWGPLVYPLLVFLAAAAVAWLAARIAYRRTPGEPWTEQARSVFGERGAVQVVGIAMAVLAFLLTEAEFVPTVTRVSPFLLASLNAVAAVLGGIWARVGVERRAGRRATFLLLLHDRLALMLVYFPHLLVALPFACVEPVEKGWTLAATVLGGMLAVVAALSGGGFAVARALRIVRPAGPRLVAAVAEAARRGGTRARPVFEMRWTAANALAFPLQQRLAFTEGALAALDDEQLRGIAAHELAHLDEPRRVQIVRVAAGAFVVFALLVMPAGVAVFGMWWPAPVLFVVFLVNVSLGRMRRRMEQRADAAAHGQEHEDGRTYGLALERIYEANMVPAVMRAKGIHPHLYDRLVAAGVTPAYPRPAPPPLKALVAAGGLVIVFELLAFVVPLLFDETARPRACVALGRDEQCLGHVALEQWKAGDRVGALALYRAHFEIAKAADPESRRTAGRIASSGLGYAGALAQAGRCEDATRALAEVEAGAAQFKSLAHELSSIRREVGDCATHGFEAAIARDPYRDDGYLAYGAWLRSQGDPRGELIDVEAQIGSKRRESDARVLAALHLEWVGDLAEALHEDRGRVAVEAGLPFDVSLRLGAVGIALPPGLAAGLPHDLELGPDGSNALEMLAAILIDPDLGALRQREADILHAHQADWLGANDPNEGHYEFRLGFLDEVEVLGPEAVARVRALTALPAGHFLRKVTFSVPAHQPVIDALVASPPPSVRAIALRGMGERKKKRPALLAELYPSMPWLESLQISIRAGGMDLGRIALPELRTFEVVAEDGLTRANVASVAHADWPKLKKLVLDFEPLFPRPGKKREPPALADLEPVFAGRGLAGVTWLALDRAPFADDLPGALANSAIVKQLTVLSIEGITDAGARALLAHASAFSHLKSLSLARSTISPELAEKLKSLCANVATNGLADDEGDDEEDD